MPSGPADGPPLRLRADEHVPAGLHLHLLAVDLDRAAPRQGHVDLFLARGLLVVLGADLVRWEVDLRKAERGGAEMVSHELERPPHVGDVGDVDDRVAHASPSDLLT